MTQSARGASMNLNEIEDKIQRFKVEPHYEPNDLLKLLELLRELTSEVRRIENEIDRTAKSTNPLDYL